MVDETKYVWIAKAVGEYKRSRAWLGEQVRHGVLTYAKFPGDKRTYLVRAELDKLLGKPEVEEKRKQDAG